MLTERAPAEGVAAVAVTWRETREGFHGFQWFNAREWREYVFEHWPECAGVIVFPAAYGNGTFAVGVISETQRREDPTDASHSVALAASVMRAIADLHQSDQLPVGLGSVTVMPLSVQP